MPPVERPGGALPVEVLPPRRAPVVAEPDVLVVGGGPAGLGAALGAADAGASVLLAERYGFLGGNATAALVAPLASYHTSLSAEGERPGDARLVPSDHGPGEPVVAGALSRLVERIVRAGGAVPPSRQTGFVVPFDPEAFMLAALDLLDEAGVRFLLHALASGSLGEGRARGVVFETKSGPLAVRARAIVDCTGDGDVATSAGAEVEVGDDHGLVQPMTLMFRLLGFRRPGFEAYVREHPDQWLGVRGFRALVAEARARGELDPGREDLLLFGSVREDEVVVNSTRVVRVLGTDVFDLTYAEWAGRRQMRQIAELLRRRVPGFESSWLARSAAAIGVRETRRVLGDYVLTERDVVQARRFDDAVARCSYPIDIHNPTGPGTVLVHLPAGQAYDLPLRSLLPRGLDDVLVAGRCISGTHVAQSSYRVMPVAMATGQAAGVCAALAARGGTSPRAVDAGEVRAELLRQGANLG